MKTGLLVLFVVAAIFVGVVGVGGCMVYFGYNQAITLDEDVKGKWAQVENQLQRRYELIPNLVETVKGVADQEQDVFLGIAKSREAYFNANSRPAKMEAARGLEGALSRLLVLRETYPQLKSNESFLKLQDSLEGTENRLAVERKRYNDGVKTLNTFRRKLLGSFYASLAGVEEAEYFEIEEQAREAPQVDFSDEPSADNDG
jgi:LemA protein